jgi:hypothetical protein
VWNTSDEASEAQKCHGFYDKALKSAQSITYKKKKEETAKMHLQVNAEKSEHLFAYLMTRM